MFLIYHLKLKYCMFKKRAWAWEEKNLIFQNFTYKICMFFFEYSVVKVMIRIVCLKACANHRLLRVTSCIVKSDRNTPDYLSSGWSALLQLFWQIF